jgi:hypothetical protein
MRLFRIGLTCLLIFGLSTATFAGDLQKSIANATQTTPQQSGNPPKIDKAYLWPGAALVAGGMTMALYGFLHTSGGEFVTGGVVDESNTALGVSGCVVAGAGAGLLFFGSKKAAKSVPSVTFARGGVKVVKKVSW